MAISALYRAYRSALESRVRTKLKDKEAGLVRGFWKVLWKDGDNILEFPSSYYKDARGYSSLSAAVADIGDSEVTLMVTSSITLTADLTTPANISLLGQRGGSINGAYTLTVNGDFKADVGFRFGASLTATFNGSRKALPEWFGAVHDGSTNDAPAINRAITALAPIGGRVYCRPGKTYGINTTNVSDTGAGASGLDPTPGSVRIRSNVYVDLCGATLQRIGENYANNVVENFNYYGASPDVNVGIGNGTIKGNGTNDIATQSHTVPAANIFWFGVSGFKIENLKLDTANGDCLGWRLSDNGIVDGVIGGSFGRNLFSPTSGMGNRISNCNFDFAGLTGAIPGAYIDVENDSADETSDTYWDNVTARGAVFVDFWTAAGGDFAHHARFVNCKFTGDSPRTFSIQSTNPTIARGFVIGDTCRIAVSSNTAAALKISQVSGVQCNALLANDSGSQGSSRAIWVSGSGSARNAASAGIFSLTGIDGSGSFAIKTLTITDTVSAGAETIAWVSTGVTIEVEAGASTVEQVLAKVGTGSETGTPWASLASIQAGAVAALASTAMHALTAYADGGMENLEFNGRVAVDEFSTGIHAVDVPIKNSRFSGVFLGDVQLREGSSGNTFTGCKIGVLTIVDSGSNEFKDTNITGTTSISTNSGAVTPSVSNDFTGSNIADLVFSGSATINNRFRLDTRITGTKTFNGLSTWLGQVFEKEEGSFTPRLEGAVTPGTFTYDTQWGRYNVLGNMVDGALAVKWTANPVAAVGDQRIIIPLPNSIVPADGISPSRWPVAIYATGFAFTGSQLVGFVSGGNDFLTLYGLDNTGALTAVPGPLASGEVYIEFKYRVR